jgi:hypothetical protein
VGGRWSLARRALLLLLCGAWTCCLRDEHRRGSGPVSGPDSTPSCVAMGSGKVPAAHRVRHYNPPCRTWLEELGGGGRHTFCVQLLGGCRAGACQVPVAVLAWCSDARLPAAVSVPGASHLPAGDCFSGIALPAAAPSCCGAPDQWAGRCMRLRETLTVPGGQLLLKGTWADLRLLSCVCGHSAVSQPAVYEAGR